MWYYQNGYYWGMHWVWWLLWFLMLIWIFAIPYNIPGQRSRREDALQILKKRLARGEIDIKEYQERKAILEKK
jgi:putative membrane protein